MPGNLIAQGQFTITDLTDTGIVATHVYYLASSSNNIKDITYTPNQLPATSSDWNQNSPKESLNATKKYLWQLIIFEYNDEPKYKTVAPSVIGNYSEEGTSISNVQTWYYYAISDDGTTPPDRDNIGDTTQNWVPNNWYESNNRGSNIPQTTPEYGYLWGMIKTTIYFTDNIADGDPGYPNQKTSYTYTVSSTADSVSVGGRNLLLHSGENELDGTEFRIARYQLAVNLTKDTQYTLSVNLLNNLVNRVMNIDANGNPIRDENGDVTYTDTRISFDKIRRFINFRLESEDGKITKPWICDGDWISIYPYESTDTNEVNHIYTYTFVNNVDLENSSKAASNDADIEIKWYLSIYAANTKNGTFNNGSNYITVNTAQLEEGNVATTWRVAPEDLIEDTDELKDIIQKIYSRVEYCLIDNGQDPNNSNIYTPDTTKAYTKQVPQGANYTRVQKILGETLDNFEHRNYIPNSREEVTLTNTALQTSTSHNFTAPTSGLSAMRGQNITVSFEVRINEPLTVGTTNAWFGINYSIYHDGTTRTYARNLSSRLVGSVGQWVKVTNTQPVADVNIVQIRDLQYLFRDIKGSVSIRNAKIEVGSTATMWTPAPEDGLLIDATPTNAVSRGNRNNLWVGTQAYDVVNDARWVDNNNATRPTSVQTATPIDVIDGFSVQRIAIDWRDYSQRVPIKPNTDYVLSAWIRWEGTAGKMMFYASSDAIGNNVNVTAQVGTTEFKRVSVKWNSGTTTESTCRFECTTVTPYLIYGLKLEEGSVATDWTPSIEDEPDQSLSANYGTLRSAGNVHDELDLANGKIIRRVGQIDLGTLNWAMGSSTRLRVSIPTDMKLVGSDLPNWTCASRTPMANWKSLDDNKDAICMVNDTWLYCYGTSLADKPTGLLNYELAEHIEEEINVTGTLLPVEEGGTITFNNSGDDYGLQVPLNSEVNFIQGTREELDNFNNVPQILTVMPSIYDIRSSSANVLWQRTSTYIRTYGKVDNTDELLYHTDWEKVNLMNGIYTFLSNLTDGGFTTIDGGKITTNTIQAIGPGAKQEWLQELETTEEDSDWYIYITNKGINLMYQDQQVGVFTGEMQTNADNSESLNIATAKFKADRVFASNVILRDNPDYDINIGFEARKNGHITLKGV